MADLKVERLSEIGLGDTANLPLQHMATHLPKALSSTPRPEKRVRSQKGVATEGWGLPGVAHRFPQDVVQPSGSISRDDPP